MSNTLNFDESFYLSQNPDVAAAISRGVFTSGAQHYQLNGRFEGRNPNAFFNTSFYLGQYPDVAKAGVNPLTHFLTSGAAEGRFANATEKAAIDLNGNGGADDFNNAKYLTDYPDVAAAVTAGTFKSAYQHFVQFGQFEGRVATLANGTSITGPFGNVPASAASVALTTGVDNLNGTSGADVYNGYVNTTNGNTTSTLTAADSINGSTGTDTLNITVEGNAAGALPAANISNVENFFVRDVNTGGASTYDFGSILGEQQVWSDRSTAAVNFTNVGAGATVGVAGNGSVVVGNVAAGYTADATVGNLAIKGGVGPSGTTAPTVTITGTGIVTQNVASTEGANKIGTLALAATTTALNVNATSNLTTGQITGAALKTVVATGAGNVDFSAAALPTGVTSVNASALTGSLSVVSGANTTAITGGSGNDTINIGNLVYDQSAKLDGGAGTDTIAISDNTATLFTTAAKANITGFEVLQVSSAATKTFDFTALSGLTALNVDTGTSIVVNNLGASTPVTVVGNQTTLVTLNVANATNALNTADSLTLTLDKTGASTTTSIVTIADIKSDGLETLNLVSQGVTGNTAAATDDNVVSSLASLSTSNVSTINVSGISDLSITTGDIARTVNINGSTATGNLTIDATADSAVIGLQGGSGNDKLFVSSVKSDVVIGNAGNDTLTIVGDGTNTGATTLTGGVGADKFAFGGTSAANALAISTVGGGSEVTNLDKITDFNFTQGDKLSLFSAASVANIVSGTTPTAITPASFTNAGTVVAANLNAAITAAFADTNFVATGNQAAVANQAILFNWNDGTVTHTYVAVNNAGDAAYNAGADFVVEITGATLKTGDASLGTLTVSDYFA